MTSFLDCVIGLLVATLFVLVYLFLEASRVSTPAEPLVLATEPPAITAGVPEAEVAGDPQGPPWSPLEGTTHPVWRYTHRASPTIKDVTVR